MSVIHRKGVLLLAAGVLALAGLAAVAPTAAFHLLSPSATGEAERLAAVLELAPGAVVADIGAGDGEMAVELAGAVGQNGRVYATEITERKREEIADAARNAGVSGIVQVVPAGERTTNLPDGCCDAIYLRTVLHHIDDERAYAGELRRALKPGGRLAIIDFRPGRLSSHGISPEDTIDVLTAAGFRLDRRIDDWGGRLYLLLFRQP